MRRSPAKVSAKTKILQGILEAGRRKRSMPGLFENALLYEVPDAASEEGEETEANEIIFYNDE